MNETGTIEIQGENPCCISFNSGVNSVTSSALISALNQMVEEGHDELHLLMNTPGGIVADGLAVYHFIRALSARVVTYNIGTVNSIGNVIYQAGDKKNQRPSIQLYVSME